MSSKVVPLSAIARTLRSTGGQDDAANSFADQTIIDLMQLAIDFHYEDGNGEDGQKMTAEDFMLEDMYEVMAEAEDREFSKIEAIRQWLEEMLTPNADDIESAIAAAASH